MSNKCYSIYPKMATKFKRENFFFIKATNLDHFHSACMDKQKERHNDNKCQRKHYFYDINTMRSEDIHDLVILQMMMIIILDLDGKFD